MEFGKLSLMISQDEFTTDELYIVRENLMKVNELINRKLVEYKSSSAMEWLDTSPTIKGRLVNDVYLDYLIWCDKQRVPPSSKIMLSKALTIKTGHKSKIFTINGKSVRIYV